LGGITKAVQLSFEYNQGHGDATQHARVVLERICRTAREATANEKFPGFIVLAEEVGSWRFPDTLVVWHPERTGENLQGLPLDDEGFPHRVGPDDLPRYDELLIYCPGPADATDAADWTAAKDLLRIQLKNDKRRLPPLGDEEDVSDWRADIEKIKRSASSEEQEIVILTSLLRTGAVDDGGDAELRGAVRFETLLRPSDEDLEAEAEDPEDSFEWQDLPWVQGIYGSRTGLRQAWVRIEIQLMAGDPPAAGAVDRRQAIPFFGSAALYYTMRAEQRP